MTQREIAKRQKDIRFAYTYLVEQLALPELEGVDRGRLDRALELALSSDPLTKYKTCWGTCECPDQGYRMRYICKHRLAYMMRRRSRTVMILWSGIRLYDSTEEEEDV